jgi:hypothetical protein
MYVLCCMPLAADKNPEGKKIVSNSIKTHQRIQEIHLDYNILWLLCILFSDYTCNIFFLEYVRDKKSKKLWDFNAAEKTFIVGKAKTMEELLYCVSNWKDTASEYKTKGVGAVDIFKMPGISKTKTYLAPFPFFQNRFRKMKLVPFWWHLK